MKETLAKSIASITKNYTGDMKKPCVFDRRLRNDKVAKELFGMVTEKNVTVVCSGKFGEYVKRVFKDYNIIHAPGGLRWKDADDPDFSGYEFRDCIIVDDGFYTGRTFGRLKRAIEKEGGSVVGVYFAYKSGEPVFPVKCIVDSKDVRRYLND